MKTFFPNPLPLKWKRSSSRLCPGLLRAAGALLALYTLQCYSAEFYPVAGYPGLRGQGKEEAEVRLSPPRRKHTELGVLVIRNYSGDLRDETFLAFLRGEIRKRGARGGWIKRRNYHRQVHYQTESVSSRRPGGARTPGGELATQVAIIRVVLYTYAEEKKSQAEK